jgi:hypothetical protein
MTLTRPPEIPTHLWVQFVQPLESPSIDFRVQGLRRIREARWLAGIPYVVPLLDANDPYVFDLRGEAQIAEVRANALETLEELLAESGATPDFGAVRVRIPMPVKEAMARADAALAALALEERARVQERVDAWLAAHPPFDEERAALGAYRALQELGLVEYRTEHVDPVTLTTPLQEEIYASQTRSPRPTPHLRVAHAARPDKTLGWLFRDPVSGEWRLDFSRAREAQAAAEMIGGVMTDYDPGGVPRVLRDAAGAVVYDPDGSILTDGIIPLDTDDPVELLRSVEAFVVPEHFAEVKT